MKCAKISRVVCSLLLSLMIASCALADGKEDIEDIVSKIASGGYLEAIKDDRRLYDGRIGASISIEMNGRERARAAMLSADPFSFVDTIELEYGYYASRIGDSLEIEETAKKLFGEPVDTSLLGKYQDESFDAALVDGVPMLLKSTAEGDGSYTFTVLDKRVKLMGNSADCEIDVFSGSVEEESLGRPTLRYTLTFKKNAKPSELNKSGYYMTGVKVTKLAD